MHAHRDIQCTDNPASGVGKAAERAIKEGGRKEGGRKEGRKKEGREKKKKHEEKIEKLSLCFSCFLCFFVPRFFVPRSPFLLLASVAEIVALLLFARLVDRCGCACSIYHHAAVCTGAYHSLFVSGAESFPRETIPLTCITCHGAALNNRPTEIGPRKWRHKVPKSGPILAHN